MSDIFTIGNQEQWYIKVTEDGTIKFNTADFPNMTAEELGKAFIESLENQKVYGGYNLAQVLQTIQALEKQNGLLEDANFGLKAKVQALAKQIEEAKKQ